MVPGERVRWNYPLLLPTSFFLNSSCQKEEKVLSETIITSEVQRLYLVGFLIWRLKIWQKNVSSGDDSVVEDLPDCIISLYPG